MARIFSGVQPTGVLHLGGYVGAFRNWADQQHEFDALYCIVDLHAITSPHDPSILAAQTLEVTGLLLAIGVDPDVSTLFVQSHVHEHTELTWLLNAATTVGELQRMTQFKAKSAEREIVLAGVLNYPVLMAADILLYQTDRVPVGEDQRQHLELTRDVAQRFNARFGPTFTVPEAYIPAVGGRVMDLQTVGEKMSKSAEADAGRINLLDPPDQIRRKIRSAVTDSGRDIVARPDKPAITNLLDLFAAVTGRGVPELEQAYAGRGYGDFKADLGDAVVALLAPLQERYAKIREDPAGLADVLENGAAKARALAQPTIELARERLGFLRAGSGG